MKLLKSSLSQLLLMAILFSNTTWAQPKLTKKPATDLARRDYPLALKVKTPEDSAWINHETIATVIVGAAIMGSLGAIIKYRGALHRTVSNWFNPAASVAAVQKAVEQITEAQPVPAAQRDDSTWSPEKIVNKLYELLKSLGYKLTKTSDPLAQSLLVQTKMQQLSTEKRANVVELLRKSAGNQP